MSRWVLVHSPFGTVTRYHWSADERRPRAQSVLRALPLLPRGVLVDVLRDRAWQITTTGATLPSGGSTRTPLRPVIEQEELRMGMVVKRMNQRQAGFYLHHARILDVLMAAG